MQSPLLDGLFLNDHRQTILIYKILQLQRFMYTAGWGRGKGCEGGRNREEKKREIKRRKTKGITENNESAKALPTFVSRLPLPDSNPTAQFKRKHPLMIQELLPQSILRYR